MYTADGVFGAVTGRPTAGRVVRIWAAALVPPRARRAREGRTREGRTVPHSAALRQTLLALVVLELGAAAAVSSMLPGALRAAHLACEAVVILAGLGAAAALARAPHEVRQDSLVLRTGFFGDVSIPREAVRWVGPVVRTVAGRGVRPVPDEPGAVACSADGTVNVALHLRPPVRLDLGAAGVVTAEALYISADSPAALHAALHDPGPAAQA